MTNADIQHMAFVLVHKLLGDESSGGCSCETCCEIRVAMAALIAKEIRDFSADNPQLGPPPVCEPYAPCDICKAVDFPPVRTNAIAGDSNKRGLV
jgi:hypothetical protein